MEIHDSLDTLARSFGLSRAAMLSRPLRSNAEIRDAMLPGVARANPKHDQRQVHDAATNFVTHQLAQQLAPVEIVTNERFLFAPGRAKPAILPVRQELALGMRSMEWQAIELTGEARHFAPGATRELTNVGTADDQLEQNAAWYGAAYEVDYFSMLQSDLLGRNEQAEKNRAMRLAMDRLAEDIGGWGYKARKIPGMFNHGAAYTLDLEKSFGNPSLTADEMMDQLKILDLVIDEWMPMRTMSGVIMPKSHRLNMIDKFGGTNGEGENRWKLALEIFPWLGNIIQDQRMLTASSSGGAMWQFWSADSTNLWYETTASPLLFGPFEDQMASRFIGIAQHAGVINKEARLLLRAQMPLDV